MLDIRAKQATGQAGQLLRIGLGLLFPLVGASLLLAALWIRAAYASSSASQ